MMSYLTHNTIIDPPNAPESDSPLVKLAHVVIKKTKELIPHVNNLPNQTYSISRDISLHLVRKIASDAKEKALIKDLHLAGIDVTKTKDNMFYVHSLGQEKSYSDLLKQVETFRTRFDKSSRCDLGTVEDTAIKAFKFGVGNCHELTALAFLLFIEYPANSDIKIAKPISIQRVGLEEEDHIWIILNKDKNIALRDFKRWNDDTVICDPWTQQVFTKKQLLESRSKEEIAKINTLFSNIIGLSPLTDYYVGEQFNKSVHTKEWLQKHQGSPKFWRAPKLTHAEKPIALGPKITSRL